VIYGTWKVTGRRIYRGHEPGEVFEASLFEDVAGRAVARGDLVLLEEFVPALPGEWCLPEGWV
jgi:hypothetical protein